MLITLAAAPGLLHLTLRTDGHALVSPTAPEVIADKIIRDQFGIHDQLVVRVQPGGTNDIFNPATLQLVRDLTAALKKIFGVGPADVISLATEPSFRLRPETLTQQKMLEPQLVSPAELAQLRDDLQRIKLYTGTLVAMDGRSTVILVGVPDSVNREQFYETILQLIAAQKDSTNEIAVTGAPVAESLFGIQILEDLGVPQTLLGAARRIENSGHATGSSILHSPSAILASLKNLGLVPLSALVMMLVLLICFRNLLAALLPLPGVAATMIFVFGLMGWLGVPIYLTTAVMPVLLTVISVTNDIYLFSRYFNLLRENPGADHITLLEETFRKLTRPVVCTAFAAVIGFLSFGFSPLVPVKMFGLFTGIGALFGLFLSLTVVPALLVLVNPKWLRPSENKSDKHSIATLAAGFVRLGNVVVRHRHWVIGGALAVIALTPFGLRRLVVQDGWTNGFAPDSEFRRVTESVNENFFGTHLLYVCAQSTNTLHGEIPVAAINGPDLTLPGTLVSEPATIIGSPITLTAGDAEWRTHIEFVNAGADKLYAHLARDESTNHFSETLAKAGRAQFQITPRTHVQAKIIRALGDLETFIRTHQQEVGGVLGPLDYLTTTRFMARTGDPDARALPDTAVEIKMMWNYYALALGPERLRQVVDTNYCQSLTTIFLKDANFQDTARLMNSIRAYENKNLTPLGIKLTFAGDVAVSQSLIGGIVSTQLQSLIWSLLGIFLVTALLGGSWRWGFFCLVPSLLAVLIKFSVMGWLDIPLGVATSMFAAMTLGIGVNCAIHLLEGFEQAQAGGKKSADGIAHALRFTGPPALINTLAVSLGFGVLMCSQVPANARLGLLLVLGLVNCFIVSVLLLPALLTGTSKK